MQLVQASRVLSLFRARFAGKVSPVHFFWGALDLAVTRFSGRSAPPHPGGAPNCADWVMVEGYSHELASCGFWPGGGEEGAFYAYAYPEPDGYRDRPVRPAEAFYYADGGQFLLPYEAVRRAPIPTRRCWPSSRTPTRPRPTSARGTARRSTTSRSSRSGPSSGIVNVPPGSALTGPTRGRRSPS